jgi:predicted DNA-binding transcriptional regulator YafY
MPIDQGIVDAVAGSNMKNVAEAPAFYSGLAMGNAIAHQQAMQTVQQAAVGSIVKKLTEIDAAEAVAVLKATSGNEVASQMASILGAINSGQQGVKSAGNTPPVTP